jgi:hypothetical protein
MIKRKRQLFLSVIAIFIIIVLMNKASNEPKISKIESSIVKLTKNNAFLIDINLLQQIQNNISVLNYGKNTITFGIHHSDFEIFHKVK